MKTLTTKILAVLCLTLASGFVAADDRRDSRHDYRSPDNPEWRLGNSRGGSRGYEILYRADSRSRWRVAPGSAVAVGDGWVLGTDHHSNGYGIYRWNGRDWSRMPGRAERIGGTYRQPWVINAQGERYVWNGYDWRKDLYGRRSSGNDHRDDHDNRRDNDRDDHQGDNNRYGNNNHNNRR